MIASITDSLKRREGTGARIDCKTREAIQVPGTTTNTMWQYSPLPILHASAMFFLTRAKLQ